MIHKPDRLSQILKILDKRVGGISILPIISQKGNEAKRFLIRGEKGSSAPLKLLSPFYVHCEPLPNKSKNHYTREASSILMGGKALSWSQKKIVTK